MTPPGSEAEIPIDNAEMVGGAATKAAIVPLRACTWHFGGLVQNDLLVQRLSVQAVTIPVPKLLASAASNLSSARVQGELGVVRGPRLEAAAGDHVCPDIVVTEATSFARPDEDADVLGVVGSGKENPARIDFKPDRAPFHDLGSPPAAGVDDGPR